MRVGDFHIVGNPTFPRAVLAPHLNTAEGQPFSEYYVAQDRDTILNYYFNRISDTIFEATANPIPGQQPPYECYVHHPGG